MGDDLAAVPMTPYYVEHDQPVFNDPVRKPVLVVMLQGWIDAGNAAANAMTMLDAQLRAQAVATFDADSFIDHRARRPVLQIRDGVNSGLVWPEIVLKAGCDDEGRDVLLLMGAEPDMNWHKFCDATLALARKWSVGMMIGLGAYPIGVPHTRPSRLSVSASTEELARQVQNQPNSVDVPAGISAALERAFADDGVAAVGLWAQVPHYVAASPYPAASAALLSGLQNIGHIRSDASALTREANELRERLDQLVASNPEHLTMLRQFEAAWDAESTDMPLGGGGPLPSGDELAAELERFLREQG